jgi:hypothetical protein
MESLFHSEDLSFPSIIIRPKLTSSSSFSSALGPEFYVAEESSSVLWPEFVLVPEMEKNFLPKSPFICSFQF